MKRGQNTIVHIPVLVKIGIATRKLSGLRSAMTQGPFHLLRLAFARFRDLISNKKSRIAASRDESCLPSQQ